jgi:signal transduction histidine kinase
MDLLNAAVAAFAHRAISERNAELLATEALSYIAAGLQADRVDLYTLSAGRRTLELSQRFPRSREAVEESLPLDGPSIAAEAAMRHTAIVRREGEGYGAATVIVCDGVTCVFAAYARRQPFADAARTGLDAIAAMYAAAMMRCNAEARLAERENWLQTIFDQLPAIISTMDTNLVFTTTRGAGLGKVSGDAAAMVGRSMADVVGQNTAPVALARNCLAGVPAQFEWTWEGRTYENRMEPLRDGGEIVGVINLGIDVTEQRNAEAALRESREELRRLSAAMHRIQENERRRIAREIHDDLGQRLTALRLDLGLLSGELREEKNSEALQRSAGMIDLVDETLHTAHRLATELRPSILDDFGFSAALEHEVESFARRTGIEVSLSIEPEDIDVEPGRATALYRVIQEALTNVARHAGATRVEVRVEKVDGAIQAEVRDNGRGIAPHELSNHTALGLIGIRERIYALAGGVTIEAAEGGGTRVMVSVPDEDSDRG